jgi:glutathione synthase
MALESGVVTAKVARITLTGNADDWYRAEPQEVARLTEFDAVMERKDPPFDMEYIYGTYLLELAQNQGAQGLQPAGSDPQPQRKAVHRPVPQFTAPTLVTSDNARLRAFHREHGDIILKPLDGMGGAGIFRVREDGMNLGSVIETLTDNGRRTIMAQRYIPGDRQRRQAHPRHRRQAGAVRAGAHPAGRRGARQPGRRRHSAWRSR